MSKKVRGRGKELLRDLDILNILVFGDIWIIHSIFLLLLFHLSSRCSPSWKHYLKPYFGS